jgi:hypothetical protein
MGACTYNCAIRSQREILKRKGFWILHQAIAIVVIPSMLWAVLTEVPMSL